MWKKKKKKKTRSEYAIWNNGYLETKKASLPLPPPPRPNDDPAESLFKQVFKITKVISI